MADALFARLDLKPEHFEAAKPLVLALIGPSRAEPGCERYDAFTAADHPHSFFFIENWRDQAAFDAHMASEHMREAFAMLGPWLAGPPVLLALQAFGPSA